MDTLTLAEDNGPDLVDFAMAHPWPGVVALLGLFTLIGVIIWAVTR